jgi:hypothetical protein
MRVVYPLRCERGQLDQFGQLHRGIRVSDRGGGAGQARLRVSKFGRAFPGQQFDWAPRPQPSTWADYPSRRCGTGATWAPPRSYRLGRHTFYDIADLDAWIEAEAAKTERGGLSE